GARFPQRPEDRSVQGEARAFGTPGVNQASGGGRGCTAASVSPDCLDADSEISCRSARLPFSVNGCFPQLAYNISNVPRDGARFPSVASDVMRIVIGLAAAGVV